MHVYLRERVRKTERDMPYFSMHSFSIRKYHSIKFAVMYSIGYIVDAVMQ